MGKISFYLNGAQGSCEFALLVFGLVKPSTSKKTHNSEHVPDFTQQHCGQQYCFFFFCSVIPLFRANRSQEIN